MSQFLEIILRNYFYDVALDFISQKPAMLLEKCDIHSSIDIHIHTYLHIHVHIDDLVQDCSISTASLHQAIDICLYIFMQILMEISMRMQCIYIHLHKGEYAFSPMTRLNPHVHKHTCIWYIQVIYVLCSWWRHQMETISALLTICVGNLPVPVNSPHKVQWRGTLMFSLICAWINGWVNIRWAGDLTRNRAHYDVTVMCGRQSKIAVGLIHPGVFCEMFIGSVWW